MAADHFCLKWNNFHCSLVNAFESLQNSEDLVDVTLMCEGRNVKAHRVILSACSPYFRNLFKETPCQHPVIILKDVLHCDLLAILQFMYQGEVLITQDGLASFLKTAELLQVSGLAGNSAAVSEQPIIPTQTVVPALTPILPAQPNSPASPKTIVNKPQSDVTFTKHVEKENFAKKEVVEKLHTRFEPDTEPMQSCSYQATDDVIIKTESDDQDFQDMDYNTLSHDSLEDSGPATEEQSILERSLKAQGMSPHSTKLYTMDLSIGPQISTLPSPNQSTLSPHPELMKTPCITPLMLNKQNCAELMLNKDATKRKNVKSAPSSDTLPSNKRVAVKSILRRIEEKKTKVEPKSDVQQQQQQQQQQKVDQVSHGSQFGKCPHCTKVYSNQSALKYHVRLVHSDMLNMFCCHLCPESFEYRESYKVHMWETHSVRN